MKVYDCFTFYNEFELLELRLKSLWDIVDYFVLVETDKNHTNEPKPFNFEEHKAEFKEFLPKIRHIKLSVNIPHLEVGDWTIENAQRNCIVKGLEDAAPDDLVFISDLDEIPYPDILQRLWDNRVEIEMLYRPLPEIPYEVQIYIPCKPLTHVLNVLESQPIVMNQTLHYFYLDWVIPDRFWQGTILARFKTLTTPQEFRNIRTFIPRVQWGGVHLSYMGGIDRVIKKITSIVDGNELVVKSEKNLTDRKNVKEAMMNGRSVYGGSEKFIPYDINNMRLPHLKEFIKKYPHFLRNPQGVI